jgi:hypothetical protein
MGARRLSSNQIYVILGLFLIVLVIVIYNTFPEGFYRDQLMDAQAVTQAGMTMVPELIGRILSVTARQESKQGFDITKHPGATSVLDIPIMYHE